MPIDYDGRVFSAVQNSAAGEVSGATRFHYHQDGDVVWATYTGGGVRRGVLVAQVAADGALTMRYSHVNEAGALRSGTCRSRPEVLPDGRLRLHETWQWDGGEAGTSVVEEVRAQGVI